LFDKYIDLNLLKLLKIPDDRFRLLTFIGHFSRYTVADVSPKILQLFLLPIYSRLISADGYGLLQLGLIVNVLVPIVLNLSQEKILYKTYDADARESDVIFGKVLNNIILSNLIFTVPIFILVQLYFQSLFISVLIIFSSVCTALSTPVTTKLVLDQNSRKLSKYVLLESVGFNLSLITTAYFAPEWIEIVFVFKGCFWGFVLLSNFPRNYNFKLHHDSKILKWSIPLLFVSLSAWSMGFLDRIMLKNVGLSMVASYSIVYRYSEILTFISSVYNKTVEAKVNSMIREKSDNQLVPLVLFIVLLCIAAGLLFWSRGLFELLINPEYNVNFDILGYLLIGIMLYQVSGWLNRYFYHWDLNWYLTAVTLVGALIAILSLSFLIPSYGLVGAAMSTCITYFMLFLLKGIVLFMVKK